MKTTGLFGNGWFRRLVVLLLILLPMVLTGCQLVRFIVHKMVPAGKGKLIPAECDALTQGKKVLVLVYADQNIQYQHQQLARFDTAAVLAAELQSKLKVDVVDPAMVEHFQAANIN